MNVSSTGRVLTIYKKWMDGFTGRDGQQVAGRDQYKLMLQCPGDDPQEFKLTEPQFNACEGQDLVGKEVKVTFGVRAYNNRLNLTLNTIEPVKPETAASSKAA